MNDVPDSSSRVAKRRTRTRAAVLAAAEQVFAERGFSAARIEDIAELADVSVGSIYSHFTNKDGIQAALAQQAIEHLVDYFTAAYGLSSSPLEQVMAAGDAYLRFLLDHPGSARFLGHETGTASPTIEAAMTALLAEFGERIAAAIAAGEADADDPALVARFLFGAWNGVAALGLRRDGLGMTPDEIAACLQQGRRIVLGGLTATTHRDEQGRSRGRLLSVE